MKAPTPGLHSKSWWGHTANDQLKAEWSNRVAWATTAAVALHMGVFLLWPSRERDLHRFEISPGSSAMEWISIYEAPADLGAIASAAIPIPTADLDTIPVGAAADAGSEGLEGDVAGLLGALRERLLRESRVVPTVVEPAVTAVDGDDDGNVGADGSPLSVSGDASTTELASSLEPSAFDLSRLSAVRPELVLSPVSIWVLIRNPREVSRFVRNSSRRNSAAEGSVGLTIWIDERGSVEWAEISEGSGRPEMDEVILASFREVAAFRPAVQDGVPVPTAAMFWLNYPWW